VVAVSGNDLLDAFLDGIDKIENLSVSPSPQHRELEMAQLWLKAIDTRLCELDRKISAMELEFFCG